MYKTYSKQLNHHKLGRSHSRGFALIFVLLFATIALMVGTSIVVALISGMNLNKQSEQGEQAYLMARGGIDAAVNNLRLNTADKNPQWPDTTCTNKKFSLYYRNDTSDYALSNGNKTLAEITNSSFSDFTVAKKYGFFAANLCTTGSTKEIESIGFFQGRKIILKAVVKENPSNTPKLYHYQYTISGDPSAAQPTSDINKEGYCSPNNYPTAIACSSDNDYRSDKVIDRDTKYDHSNDLIKIYQTGS